MIRYEIIPNKFWKRKTDGFKVSLWGAVPWTSEAEKADWDLVTDGYSIRDRKQGTVLTGGKTRTEAEIRKSKLETLGGNEF